MKIMLGMIGVGGAQLLLLSVVVLLLFGNRLPGTMRALGQSLKAFREGAREEEVPDPQMEVAGATKVGHIAE